MENKEFVEGILDTVICAVAAKKFMMELDKTIKEETEGIRPMYSEESKAYRRMIHNLYNHREEI